MPNLLLAISGICIVAFVLRETLEDLQKKKEEHDRHHVSSDEQGSRSVKARCCAYSITSFQSLVKGGCFLFSPSGIRWAERHRRS